MMSSGGAMMMAAGGTTASVGGHTSASISGGATAASCLAAGTLMVTNQGDVGLARSRKDRGLLTEANGRTNRELVRRRWRPWFRPSIVRGSCQRCPLSPAFLRCDE